MTGRVVVVGSGVVGLSVAVQLAEAGRAVAVVAAEPWPETTSRVAGGVWHPYLVGGSRVAGWAMASHRRFAALAAAGAPGVRTGPIRELVSQPAGGLPGWAGGVPGARTLRAEEVPAPFVGGVEVVGPLVDTGLYLPWLAGRLAAAGGTITLRRLADLAEAGPADAVVNCAGLGGAALAGDTSARPVRGQVVVVANPGLDGAVVTDAGVYAIAHPAGVVLGGTADEGATDLRPDPEVARAILARARPLLPPGAPLRVVAHRVGLRPWRPEVRLEEADAPAGAGRLVHCYGHGGAGVTLSWGCAEEVSALLGG